MAKICLKAPQSYSAPIWTYNFSICLCERTKPNISMISEFLRPVGALISGFGYAKSFGTSMKFQETLLEIILFEKLELGKLKIEN